MRKWNWVYFPAALSWLCIWGAAVEAGAAGLWQDPLKTLRTGGFYNKVWGRVCSQPESGSETIHISIYPQRPRGQGGEREPGRPQMFPLVILRHQHRHEARLFMDVSPACPKTGCGLCSVVLSPTREPEPRYKNKDYFGRSTFLPSCKITTFSPAISGSVVINVINPPGFFFFTLDTRRGLCLCLCLWTPTVCYLELQLIFFYLRFVFCSQLWFPSGVYLLCNWSEIEVGVVFSISAIVLFSKIPTMPGCIVGLYGLPRSSSLNFLYKSIKYRTNKVFWFDDLNHAV